MLYSITKIFKLILVVLCIVIFSGCGKKFITAPTIYENKKELQAQQALENKEWLKSKQLFSQLLNTPNLGPEKKSIYLKGLAISYFHTNDCFNASHSIETIFSINPSMQNDWELNKILFLCMQKNYGNSTAEEHILRLCLDKNRNWELRQNATLFLFDFYLKQEKALEAILSLKEISQNTPQEDLGELEESLFNFLKQKDFKSLEKLKENCSTQSSFPENVILFSYFYILSKDNPTNWPFCWSRLKSILRQNTLHSLLFSELVTQLEEKWGTPEQELVLLLPLSGPYAHFGWQIFKGASLAQWQLMSEGQSLKIKVINSFSNNWIKELENSSGQIVGGPIAPNKISKVFENNLEKEKIFFVFSPKVKEEGKTIWRFFPSSRDQIRALLNTCTYKLGISRFAILYPEENYGKKMAKIFLQEISNSTYNETNATVTGLLSYPATNPKKWGEKVAKFLGIEANTSEEELDPNSEEKKQNKEIFPEPDFDAVFIPDSFSRVRAMIPYFFFYNEPTLYFLGPALWDNSSPLSSLEKNYFALSMYPGPWWDSNPSAATSLLQHLLDSSAQGKANFWVALGFDFVRFFASLPQLNINLPPAEINKFLQKAKDFNWSMAPFSWNESGLATQKLYLFSVLSKNKKLLDLKKIQKIRKERIEKKIQQKETQKNNEEKTNVSF